ncbi:NADPH-dependent 7-cyano-7-deazaguanine reductase QueF [Salinispirillum sp. LH 10-3-1]|uniref:NADPH-dependent 7-cyano-7-deazaguanine reductase n=1 Tax=Salinispirillum sp. LH 10-3-1 TaxID=2952525 RepID=A0AB38YIQ1_9GAMM
MADLKNSALGREVDYPQEYEPSVLFPVPRADNRQAFGLTDWPYYGFDLWNAYELSWLNDKGLPQVGMAIIELPAQSPNIIESKSLKLYLNSFNMTRLSGTEELHNLLVQDLSRVSGGPVSVRLLNVDDYQQAALLDKEAAVLLDTQDIAIDDYEVDSSLLQVNTDEYREEMVYSHLLRSNCPVTGQPDWGTLFIAYAGPALSHEALLKYICSFRSHTEFHEHCVERVFMDILALGTFDQLTVTAKYVRRGGLDINPCRSLHEHRPDMGRLARQ